MELLISIGILSTALLLVVGVFTFLFRASQKSVDMTAGTIVAESILQEEVQKLTNDKGRLEAFLEASYASETLWKPVTVKPLNQAEFFYCIYAQDASTLAGPAPAGSSRTTPMKLKKLRLVCSWWDSGGGLPGRSRAGYGTISVELNRLIYDGDY